MFISPNNSALMGSAPRNRQGIAAGILATARNFGMVLGVGLAGAVFTTILTISQPSEVVNSTQSNLFLAIRISFIVAACTTFLGIFTSAAREGQASTNKDQIQPG
jgi:MFS family permease